MQTGCLDGPAARGVAAPCLDEGLIQAHGAPAPSRLPCLGRGTPAEASPGWASLPRSSLRKGRASRGRSHVLPLEASWCSSQETPRGLEAEKNPAAGRLAGEIPARSTPASRQLPSRLLRLGRENKRSSPGPAEAQCCWSRGGGRGGRRRPLSRGEGSGPGPAGRVLRERQAGCLGQCFAKQTFALWYQRLGLQHEQRYRAALVLPRDIFPLGPGSSAHWDQQGLVRGSWLGTGTGHGSEKLGEAQPDTARMKCGLARGCRLRAIPTGSWCSQAPTDSAALSGC